jgi:hypothetical protein
MTSSPATQQYAANGALVTVSPSSGTRVIEFQYNPESLRRTIEPNTVGGRPGTRSQSVRYAGAPAETISFDCQLTANGDRSVGNASTSTYGVAPALAALALLAYPSSQAVQSAQSLLDSGAIEVVPPLADELLFVWGASRVVPCRVESLTITEQLYDPDLVPILATVSLTLRVLTYSDVDVANPAYHDFFVYQQSLEQLRDLAYPASG